MLTLFRKRIEIEANAQRDAEIAQQFAAEREEVASGRLGKIQELAAVEVALRADLDKARATFERGESEREAAASRQRKAVSDADYALRGAVYPRQGAIDAMESRLRGELCPASITDALVELAELYEATRGFVDGENYAAKSKLLAWCRDTRQKLLDLQLMPSDDIPAEVARIMASRPA